MINKPLVTIVSLLYDIKKEYVNECIKSLLNQSYKNLEIIFIDDCSPTINYDYITSISPKIKLVKNEKNLGMNKTAQKVFNMAHGKYVVRIDSDDVISRSLIEKEVIVPLQGAEVGDYAYGGNLPSFGRLVVFPLIRPYGTSDTILKIVINLKKVRGITYYPRFLINSSSPKKKSCCNIVNY